jgi:membrane protein YdbS with pleckstrin-like domain
VDQASDPAAFAELEHRVMAIVRPKRELLTLYLLYSVFSLIAFPFVFPFLYFRYHTLKFRFDREGVGVSYGILFRKEHYLTYARIQDIHLTRDLFERWLGIGSVQIQTASGSASPEVGIVGTDQFDMIRDYLYIRMRGAREHRDPATPAGAGGAAIVGDGERVAAALREVAAGLREAAAAMRGASNG